MRTTLALCLIVSGCVGSVTEGTPEPPPVEDPCRHAGDFAWPTPGNTRVVQPFGNPIQYQSCGFHTGVDIAAATGDPIVAIAGGEVVHVGPMWLDGTGTGRGPYAIILDHGDGLYSTYGHNDAAHVEVGGCVAAGDPIADAGNLGYSFGPHLHLEVLTGTAFTGDWMVPFADACSRYEDPALYVAAPRAGP